MKKRNIKIALLSLTILLLLVFFSALALNFLNLFQSKSSVYDSNDTRAPSLEMPEEEYAGEGDLSYTSGDGLEKEKIIATFYLDFETLAFEKDLTTLKALVTASEGYIESSDIYQKGSTNGKTYQRGTLTLKIPKNKANDFLEESKNNFHLIRENSNAQNVTLYYRDTKLRLETLETQKNRLNELYEQAERLEDIIAIESKLSDVILQIESIKGELEYLDRAIDYATITVSLNEVANLSNNPDIRATFMDRVSTAFKDSLRFFKDASTTFIVFLVYALPFIGIILIILIPILFLRRKRRMKNKVTEKVLDDSNGKTPEK